MQSKILDDKLDALSSYCRSKPIRSLRLFGSYLHGTAKKDSDIDLLVELDPAGKVGLFALTQMQFDLVQLTGRDIDLRTPGELSAYFRDQVLAEAKTLYVRYGNA